jgi:hypothetical protein
VGVGIVKRGKGENGKMGNGKRGKWENGEIREIDILLIFNFETFNFSFNI